MSYSDIFVIFSNRVETTSMYRPHQVRQPLLSPTALWPNTELALTVQPLISLSSSFAFLSSKNATNSSSIFALKLVASEDELQSLSQS